VGVRILQYEHTLALKNRELERYTLHLETLAQERAKQLVHADRMATLGMMSAGIAHEINNPASFISGNIQTLERFWPELKQTMEEVLPSADETRADRLRFILEEMPKLVSGMRNGVSRISRIVKGLKIFAHQDAGEQKPCDINECIAQALELCNNRLKTKVAVETHYAEDMPMIVGDMQQLEQIFVNLIMNGADALEDRPEARLVITTSHDDSAIRVTVQDNGRGIPERILKDIWKPFYTTKEVGKGTGLGLPIVMGIVESHKGTITVENTEPSGARFTITLPLQLEEDTA
jgi:C4-dicarboxylate-specific signal transduction histidine kinase